MTTQGEYITVRQAFRIANPFGLSPPSSNTAPASNIDIGPFFISTIEGLGTFGYISTPGAGGQDPTTVLQSNLGSTIRGLGTFRYVSSTQLTSTVQGLGTLGYLSSIPSVLGVSSIFVSSIRVSTIFSYSISTSELIVTGLSTLTVSGDAAFFKNITIESVNASSIVLESTIQFNDLGNFSQIPIYASNNFLYLGSNLLVPTPVIVSSVSGLGSLGYISSTQLISSVQGLRNLTNSTLTSTIQGLGTLGYLSSFGSQVSQGGLTSSLQGLGTLGYLSSFGSEVSQGGLTSSLQGLGTLGYLSSTSVAPRLGNTLTVDQIHGNDTTASPSGTPYQTINAAVNALLTGDSIWILPGNYTLSGPITLPANTSIRGLSLQTVIISMSNVTTNVTMITMGENTRLEDCAINLHSVGNYNLTGIQFPGTTNMTAKLRSLVINVNNSSAASLVASSDIFGVHVNGTGNLGAQSFSYNFLKSLTINIYSNGLGRKRGILVDGSNAIASTRDVNIYVQQPPNTNSTGSYVGVETSNTSCSIQLRNTNIAGPLQQGSYTSSDILQTLGRIELGPGTDLVTKTAGTSSFISYVYPAEIYYGAKGVLNIANLATSWLWPGTGNVQAASGGNQLAYPDDRIGYYRITQKTLIYNMAAYLTTAPGIITQGALQGSGCSTLVTVQKNGSDIPFFIGYGGTDSGFKQLSSLSVSFEAGDLLSLKLSLSTLTSNASHDLSVQLSKF